MQDRISYKHIVIGFYFLFFIVFFTACIEPVESEFELMDDLITVEAIISSTKAGSFVIIKESARTKLQNYYNNVFINRAEVVFTNISTGETVNLIEKENIYLPPTGFVALVGDTWELNIKLEDGRQYKSLPEKLLEPVAILNMEVHYDPKLLYIIGADEYLPGHSIVVDFDDPADKKNYYYWNFRSFEPKTICLDCETSFFRDGGCKSFFPPGNSGNYPNFVYTYLCETDCWQIRYNENIKILDDEFVNGSTIKQLPIADILLYTNRDILVEVQQLSLSQSGYKYYKVLKDLVENNSGFNAPPPAALVGNIFNPNNEEEYVLGRFTAVSALTETVFIKRNTIQENAIESEIFINPESFPVTPVPPFGPGGEPVLYAPCVESRHSTGTRPKDWP